MNNHPPKLPLRFFRWFCDPEIVEDVEGDLLERFDKRPSRWHFALEVLKLFRPGVIKAVNNNSRLNFLGMLAHNIKISIRNFRRFKASFAINLVGLTSGLVTALLIYLWINNELSIDQFHPKKDHLFQVMQNVTHGGELITIDNTPALLGKALADELPEVNSYTSVLPVGSYGDDGIAIYKEKKLKASEEYASQNYLQFFNYEMLYGSKEAALKDISNVVLSEAYASRLFGEKNPVGEIIEWTKSDTTGFYTVTGVTKKLPDHSSRSFDLIFTLDAFLKEYPHIKKWGNSDPSTYIEVREGTDISSLNRKIKHFIASKQENYSFTLFLQKYADKYLYGNYENGAPIEGRMRYVKLFSLIGILILSIACINFMNLATARASRRLKEIGVKKAMGASRFTLAAQYFTESFILTFLSAGLALLLVQMLLPVFNDMLGSDLNFSLSSKAIKEIILVLIFTAVLSGSYPAIYLSGFKPAGIFMRKVSGSITDLWARKGLVVFQFSISILLITAVLIISNQIDFLRNKRLGFKKENIIYFNTDGALGKKGQLFIEEIKRLTGVDNAAMFGHDLLGGRGTTTGLRWDGKGKKESIRFGNLEVGTDLIETFEMELVAGRTFSSAFGDESSKILFNEEAIKAMHLKDPIGKTVTLWGRDREIIGVVKNFHFESLHHTIRPCFFQYSPVGSSIVVRIEGEGVLNTIEQIEKVYHTYNPGLAFSFHFFDREYDQQYRAEIQLAQLSRAFAVVTIIISCLGLLGLVAFTAEKRQKEIGIRKVLGSSVSSLAYLLNKDFSRMVVLAVLISLPIGYIIMSKWLEGFAYHIILNLWVFPLAGLATLLLAWMMISFQTIKTASANPVAALKDE